MIGDEDLNLDAPNTHSFLEYEGIVPSVYAWKDVEPYAMHGSIDTAPDLPIGDTRAIIGFFRDEIYVASESGNPVRVEFLFELDVFFNLWDTEGGEFRGEMVLVMGCYPDGSDSFVNGSYQQLDFFSLKATPIEYTEEPIVPEDEPYVYFEYLLEQESWDEGIQSLSEIGETEEGNFSFFDAIEMTSDGFSNGGLVESGTWLPISIGLGGHSRDSSLDWSDSMMLLDVVVYDGVTGIPLAPGSYTAVSVNNNFPSHGHDPGTAVTDIAFDPGIILHDKSLETKH